MLEKMLLKCRVIGKQDPEEASKILGRVASELIREGKIKLPIQEYKISESEKILQGTSQNIGKKNEKDF